MCGLHYREVYNLNGTESSEIKNLYKAFLKEETEISQEINKIRDRYLQEGGQLERLHLLPSLNENEIENTTEKEYLTAVNKEFNIVLEYQKKIDPNLILNTVRRLKRKLAEKSS